jgi:mannose-1-phosphate guanylyltransferase/mannose-6-phosphate isomerase
MILPVIMAGGSGSRLWPLSRASYPKQFLKLHGENTLLQETLLRLNGLTDIAPLLICNEEHRFIAAEQLRALNSDNSGIILEPVGRNTAPAIALAALQATKNGDDPLLLVLAADHVIDDTKAFQASVEQGAFFAKQGKLVTFGIVANKPEIGYGYIQRGEPLESGNAYHVKSFVEKPVLEIAKEYLTSGNYYWNSGMFIFKASKYLTELQKYKPEIYNACELALSTPEQDLDFTRLDIEAFKQCPDDSIDYAVMENTEDAVVVPMDAGWNDIGGFSALWEVSKQCENGNASYGDVIEIDSKNTFAFSEDKLIAVVGVENLVVVSTKDAVLVTHKDKAQSVKKIVNQLKAQGRTEANLHREVCRPWGKYDSIDKGERFQVKRITVKPGAKLSVQMHHHRAEHWIVVSGTAKVTINNTDQLLTENQSAYIPITAVHALENVGMIDLELIEVQSGSYLDEDDIVRFEDRYGRVK